MGAHGLSTRREHRLEIGARPGLPDPLAARAKRRLVDWGGLDEASLTIHSRRVYHLDVALDEGEADAVLAALTDPVAEVGARGRLDDPPGALSIEIGLLPGVTDSVGISVKRAVEDCLGRALSGRAYAGSRLVLQGASPAQLERGVPLLHNPLLERVAILHAPGDAGLDMPRAGSDSVPRVQTVPLRSASDEELRRISDEGVLALSLVEMQAIRDHFVAQGRDPTDGELECLAQTWSEHCKHKIFGAPIEYAGPDGASELIEEGVFKRYIRGATEAVAQARLASGLDAPDAPFLVSVFHDNAGVVRLSDDDHLVYKVETHNSPSALDPYGGAMTGIVGVNRDSFGTGLGADLLTNVWGYCFGEPEHDGELPPGLMHPRRIRDGVHHGVIDGGNQSGIPYARGWELFDARYVGKPLVFCGTVAVMPATTAKHPTHVKRPEVGDAVVMVGGRIGKDGIHGATFSSVQLDEHAPVQAVQIGDPITQKMMFDLLAQARDEGLLTSMTDNGAGGLSSSVGEMAEATGGARIDLAAAPLKYPGLAPWEILVSEAQERMTVGVQKDDLPRFLELSRRREVESTVLGEFTDSGRFEVNYEGSSVVDLPLSFLHDGLPRVTLTARADYPSPQAPPQPIEDAALGAQVLSLLEAPNLASAEDRARHYDHEVKGLSVVKPLLGVRGDVPSTATVLRVRAEGDHGVVLGEGVHPFYAELSGHAMARACVDEGVRRVLCAGARLDRLAALDNFCWPDPVESERTPDGQHKLAQLVDCCRGLYEACVAYGLPLISGKDSMKNDAFLGGVKISIPPTLLVSVMGQLPDVSKVLTLVPRAVGDEVWLLGPTLEHLGGTEIARRLGLRWPSVPQVEPDVAMQDYRRFTEARDADEIRSAHVVSRGGLAVALAHLALASDLGLELSLDDVGTSSAFAALFSETPGRIVLTAAPEHAAALRSRFASRIVSLGRVTAAPRLTVARGSDVAVDLPVGAMRDAFASGLRGR